MKSSGHYNAVIQGWKVRAAWGKKIRAKKRTIFRILFTGVHPIPISHKLYSPSENPYEQYY